MNIEKDVIINFFIVNKFNNYKIISKIYCLNIKDSITLREVPNYECFGIMHNVRAFCCADNPCYFSPGTVAE